MPIPELMTWVAAQRRWTKMYAGRRYYVSARKLGCVETKEASLHAANQWWRDKQAEIDYAAKANAGLPVRQPQPMEDIAAASMGVSPQRFGEMIELFQDALSRRNAENPEKPIHVEQLWREQVLGFLRQVLFNGPGNMSEDAVEQLPPARAAQLEAAAKAIRGETESVDPKRSLGTLIEDWLRGQKSRASIKDITPTRYKNLQTVIAHFCAFVGPSSDVSIIDAERLEAFYHFCLSRICDKQQGRGGGWSVCHAKRVFSIAQRFLRWLWERGLIELPKNIGSRDFRFRETAKQIATWTAEEVQHVFGEAPGKLKLALLLMLNCGMTQQDVSDLLDAEVDWKRGTVTRKRSKTRGWENVPVVTYRLWPLTWQLLRQFRSGKERVLLTISGRPFVRRDLVNGKVVEADIFSAKWRKLAKRLDFKKPMKQLRKTAATALESHEVYGRFTGLFLGHAPASIKDRHYAAPPQALFDEAVLWLGKQFGFIEDAEAAAE